MITIILPISRRDFLRPIFNCLAQLKKPNNTELLIITDGDKDLEMAVNARLDQIHFARVRVESFGEAPAESIYKRRDRIGEIHNFARYLVPDECEYVFLIEDDTVYPPESLEIFLEIFNTYSQNNLGYVGGLELGRHNTPYIGAWKSDNAKQPMNIKSIYRQPAEGMIGFVDASGLYCCLVLAKLYKNHDFKPYAPEVVKGLGCDVRFGMSIGRQGYGVVVSGSVLCDHIGVKGAVNFGNSKPVQVEFTKRHGKWQNPTVVKPLQ